MDSDEGTFGLSYYQKDTSDPVSLCDETKPFQKRHRILLDSGSTINTFKDRDLVSNLKKDRKGIVVLTNYGNTNYSEKGSFGSLSNVWFHPDGLENIVSPRIADPKGRCHNSKCRVQVN